MKRKNLNNLEAEKSRLSKLLFRSASLINTLELKPEKESSLKERKPAWIDEDDDNFTSNKILDTKCKDFYANTLKQKYVTLMGTPKWAKLERFMKEDSDAEDDHILRSVGHLHSEKQGGIAEGRLDLKRFPKINSETGNEGPIIKSLEFHPTSSVALVGGQSGVISLFTIGGDKNRKLHSVSLPNFRLLNAHFTPDGNNAVISSDKNHSYCLYNLIAANATLVHLPKIVKKPTVFEMSPCGKYLAVADGYDEIHIICAISRELLRSLKQSTPIEAVAFSPDSKKLYSFGNNGTVTAWNMLNYRAEHKFMDDGCVTGSRIAISQCGRLLATGSGEGIVNIYDTNSLNITNPKPLRVIENLQTKITSLKFNASSEILELSSSLYPNSIKLVHIPSYHVFSNFPEPSSNFHQIAAFNFSPNSGYMALSNNKNCAYLYRLKHYMNY